MGGGGKIIDYQSVRNYVELPDYIYKALEEKRMSLAHFSDILRTALLVKYGGIWIDSTVLLTAPLPAYITEEPLFIYQKSHTVTLPHLGSNWLIAAHKNHPIMKRQLELLYAYWKNEYSARDYFIYHIFLYLLSVHNLDAKKIFNQMPYIPNSQTWILLHLLQEPFSQKQWDYALQASTVHKLTYKGLSSTAGTFYEYIINTNQMCIS